MKNPRFYTNNYVIENEKMILINDIEMIHQVKNVLRLGVGSLLTVINEKNEEFKTEIVMLSKKELKLLIKKFSIVENEKNFKLILSPAIIKKDKLEYVLQKCTEIGVDEFRPLISERTEKIGINYDRARKIIKEAIEQSGQIKLPEIKEHTTLKQINSEKKKMIDRDNQRSQVYYLDMDAPEIDTLDIRNKIRAGEIDEINFYIGPEGGWDDKDRKILKELGVKPISLGKKVLRAETASIAIASIILLPANL